MIYHALFLALLLSSAQLIAQPVTPRVITLSPHATELVIAAGGADYLVGAALAPGEPKPSELPQTIETVASFGGIDREQLLRLSPDLVVSWPSGLKGADLRWLSDLADSGMLAHHPSEPRNLAAIAAEIRTLGALLDTQAVAETAASAFEQALNAPCAQANETVFVEVWPKPTMSLGGQHWLNDALGYAKLKNTLAHLARGFFTVEREALWALQQDHKTLALHAWATPDQLSGNGLNRPSPALLPALKALCLRQNPEPGTAPK